MWYKRIKAGFPLGEFLRANMKGRHCIGLNSRNLLGYVSLNQYNVFLSYSREEIRLVENNLNWFKDYLFNRIQFCVVEKSRLEIQKNQQKLVILGKSMTSSISFCLILHIFNLDFSCCPFDFEKAP